ncbi:SRPBCC domain-containing protein [Mycolicibacterium goodii]|uniref:SRPBCC family protein n=1 Tax=Mycolicibacterium goodii TaxID=134601 RepID=UPI001BDC6232|nr:SRPBCC domain-containing protein [Mycolicibacterium goodii]MBU8813219.1 SRPBCC domain-containing protein [Mycolicibacterium goodii]
MTESPTVRVQRVMPAALEVVFDEWLDPDALMDWMCPRPVRCVAVSVEPRVGGRLRFDVDDTGSAVLITGQFLEIDRPRRLRFTWTNSDWSDPSRVSIVQVEFEGAGEGETLMSIEHSLLPPEEYDGFHHGWIRTFEQLDGKLRRGA